jgi:hypothetical protein
MNSKGPLRVLTHGSQSILCELCGLLFRIFGSAESSRKSLICRRSSTKDFGSTIQGERYSFLLKMLH